MNSNTIQLELEEDSITLRIQALTGVLTSKTFNGQDCYLQLIMFLKKAFSPSSTINATVFVK
jgi:hypothetical protein